MTSLREELRNTLNPWLADEVIQIFEKRIDSFSNKLDLKDRDNRIGILTLNKFKREMLK